LRSGGGSVDVVVARVVVVVEGAVVDDGVVVVGAVEGWAVVDGAVDVGSAVDRGGSWSASSEASSLPPTSDAATNPMPMAARATARTAAIRDDTPAGYPHPSHRIAAAERGVR